MCIKRLLLTLTVGFASGLSSLAAYAIEPAPIPPRKPIITGSTSASMQVSQQAALASPIESDGSVRISLPNSAPVPPRRPASMGVQVAQAGGGAAVARQAAPQAATSQPRAQGASASLVGRLPGANASQVKTLLEAYRRDDFNTLKRNISQGSLTGLMAHWLHVRHPRTNATFDEIRAFLAAYPGWADSNILHRRAEGILWERPHNQQTVINYFGGRAPLTLDGRLALARAERQAGRTENATRRISAIWRNDDLSQAQENRIISEFGALLTASDHAFRFHYQLMAGNDQTARRALPRLSANERAIADRLIAALNTGGKRGADSLAGNHPSGIFVKAQLLRRDQRFTEAAEVFATAPKEVSQLINPEAWWRERKIIIRNLLDQNANALAYQIAMDARPESREDIADVLFHRGWVALRYMNRAEEARRHFSEFRQHVATPISLARGDYWLGRAHAALGNASEAATAYRRASQFNFTYYGQLAMEELGERRLTLAAEPAVSQEARARFDQRLDIQLLKALIAAEAMFEAGALAMAITDDDKTLALQSYVAGMMRSAGYHRYQVIIGKRALGDGLPMQAHAYPAPSFGSPRLHVERALIYSIARQESEFNPQAVSRANAMGVVQVLPDTARLVANRAGMPFSQNRLLSDPAYNMTIGSYYLNMRISQYNGSLPMAIAAYNAGERRIDEWLPRFGDPRRSKDAIDWVERIPFGETRNYVQRVLENVQVYRAQFDNKPVSLKRDLYGR